MSFKWKFLSEKIADLQHLRQEDNLKKEIF
jgi:hypothetical protein